MFATHTLKANSKAIGMIRARSGTWSHVSTNEFGYHYLTNLADRRKQLLVKRDDGAFWMCFKDWVDKFSTFDICLLPTEFSENGPKFTDEVNVSGVFQVIVQNNNNVFRF